MTNHYATLEVPRGATRDEIVRAYRRLARRHHPDVGGDPDRFLALQAAYEVLADPSVRLRYDAELTRVTPARPAPPTADPSRPRYWRPPPPARVTPPSVAASTLASALACAALAATAVAPLLVTGGDRRFVPALAALGAEIVLARLASCRARTQLERVRRVRTLWSWGLAAADPDHRAAVSRCARIATFARIAGTIASRASLVVVAVVAFAAASGSPPA